MSSDEPRTWVLTGSPENYEATRARGFSVIGIKERNRARALQIEPGDRIVLYLTKVMAFAGSIVVTGEMYEDRTKIWPGKPGKADAYPWRFPTEPEVVLERDEWVPAETLATGARAHSQVAARPLEARVPGPVAHGLRGRLAATARAHGGGGQHAGMTRLIRAWGALTPEQRLATVAALALLLTMFCPWYELQSLNLRTRAIESHSISAFGDVSFVEAAVFLVAAGVIALMFARAERRDFHMPGSDGAVVMIAGCWAALLIFYRVFSRPSGNGYPVGIEWGFFLAFVAAGALAYAGWRMRATHPPEPPLLRTRGGARGGGQPHEGPSADEDITVLAPQPPRRERSATVAERGARPSARASISSPSPSPPPSPAGAAAPKRPRYPPAPPDQLSFEDQPPERDER